MQLNPQQQEAVEALSGPMLIIAGAGSGKTATLTQRIAYMISVHKVDPSSILALTFTNKAASEMKERTARAIGETYHAYMMKNRHLPYIGTFHSFGIFILKELLSSSIHELVTQHIGLKKDFIIYDESDKLSVMKMIIRDELGLIEKDFPARQVAYFISDAKNKSISVEAYKSQVDSQLKEVVLQVYERYQKRLSENNALDFDDILGKLLESFRISEVLQNYQERYRYLMIDEYQDTNMVQYEIVALLAEKYNNLAVVGDDWQSIYSWRGADMRNIIHFKKDYPEAKVIKLEQNYRSTKYIIEAANIVIKNNIEALKKELWTDNPQGEKIHLLEAYDDRGEANWIAENIEEYIKKPVSDDKTGLNHYSDNLILYRTNAQSRSIEEALIKKTIPYKVVGGLKFYERKEVKDILAYLRCILNPSEPVAFQRIINTPTRGIGAKTIEILTHYKESFAISYIQVLQNVSEIEELRGSARLALQEISTMFDAFTQASFTMSVSALIGKVIQDIHYEDFLRKEFSGDEFDSKKENLTELQNVASEYDGLTPREGLSLFLEEVALISSLETLDGQEQDFVTLMTIHTAKGLEQKRVFVTGLEEGLFPNARTLMNPKELEEERRLMYVAMTRAREYLFLTRAKERLYFGDYVRNPLSRFVKEIPENCIEIVELGKSFSFDTLPYISSQFGDETTTRAIKKPLLENNVGDFKGGMRVYHHKFGEGIIESLLGENAEIRFREGIKKMNIRIAPVKLVL